MPLPGGGQLTVPVEALEEEVTLGARVVDAAEPGLPALPAWGGSSGVMLELTPHNLHLQYEATLELPGEPDAVLHAPTGGDWEPLYRVERSGGMTQAKLASFSYFAPVSVECSAAQQHSQGLMAALTSELFSNQSCTASCGILRLPDVQHPSACIVFGESTTAATLQSLYQPFADSLRLLPAGCPQPGFEITPCTNAGPVCNGQCEMGAGNDDTHSVADFISKRTRLFSCGDPLLNDGNMVYLFNAHQTDAVSVQVAVTQSSSVDPEPTVLNVDVQVPPRSEVPIAFPSLYLSCTTPPFSAGTHEHDIVSVTLAN